MITFPYETYQLCKYGDIALSSAISALTHHCFLSHFLIVWVRVIKQDSAHIAIIGFAICLPNLENAMSFYAIKTRSTENHKL